MLLLDLTRIMADRGITHPAAFLRQNGFTSYTAHKLLHGQLTATSFKNIEKLCLALFCSPSELFTWQPPAGSNVHANHPLHKRKANQQQALASQIRQLSPEQMEELRKYVSQLQGHGDE